MRQTLPELPKHSEQKEILAQHLKTNNVTFTNATLDRIVGSFDGDGYNGRNLQSLAEQLAEEAFEKMSNKTIKNAQLQAGETQEVPLKLTESVIDSVTERFKSSRTNNNGWTNELLRAQGIR